MTSSANDRQVGGDHYRTGGLQMWDLLGPEFLVGCAVKHVSRWRKKNGAQDLEKALHYAQKLREIKPQYRHAFDLAVADDLVDAWMRNTGMDWVERTICSHLLYCNSVEDVDSAIAGIQYLIDRERNKTTLQSIVDMQQPKSVILGSGEMWSKELGKVKLTTPGGNNGANGMRPGDRVQYDLDGRVGTAIEFLQDGDAVVLFDDAVQRNVKWNHLSKLEPPQRGASK